MNREYPEIIDIHSHILPGIDDGSDSWDESLQMLKIAYEGGVRALIATPHFLPWEEEHNTARVRGLCGELMERAKKELDIEIPVYPGQELYYYGGLPADLDKGRALTLAGTRNVLIEFAESVRFEEIKRAVTELGRSGYRPVIAHFERFACLREKGRVGQIKEAGAAIQSNIHAVLHERKRSFSGYRWLKRQYERQLIDYTGSDMHNASTRPPVRQQDIVWYKKHLPEGYFRGVMGENAWEIIRNKL